MRRTATTVALLTLTAACGPTRVPSHSQRPGMLGAACAGARATCTAPLACMPVPPETVLSPSDRERGYESTCTLSCASDADCPSWPLAGHEADHCGPMMQSHCVKGQCQYAACK